MNYQQITCHIDNHTTLITLNRPEKLNAWTHQMSRELTHAITQANEDSGISAIIITGAGRGFCAGADMQDTFNARIEGQADDNSSSNWVSFARSSKPLIAAVNGAAVGVGITMLLPFDLIIASEEARFGFFFVKMGLVPELASSHFLVQRVGFTKASEMCMTGQLYSAEDALSCGLINEVLPAEELLPRATEIAHLIGANPGPQLRMIKTLLTENGSETDLNLVQKREGDALQQAYQSVEHKEAVQAFLEKRQPDFKK